jgi:alpha/beta superfamily hydrolase
MKSGMTTVAASPMPEASPMRGPAIHSPRVRTVDLAGPAGKLEAIVNEGAPDSDFAAVVCHPHPLGGGTLHNKVVYHAMKVLNAPEWGLGWPVLRFNFRGTGLSEGVQDGHAETGDVLAALDWIENEYNLPAVVVGFSFGAAMALHACCGRGGEGKSAVRAIAALGLPTHAEGRDYHYSFLKDCGVPKLFLSGDRDQYAPSASLEQVVATAAEPKQLLFVPAADHFFAGQLEPMQRALAGWLASWLKEQVL